MKALGVVCSLIFLFADPAILPRQSTDAGRGSAPGPNNAGPAAVKMRIRNVDFHFSDRIVVHISTLDGKLAPNGSAMPVFDDKQSFALDVDSAEITVTTAALANDLNDYVFAAPGAPVKALKVSTDGNDLVLKGLLVSKGAIPFETVGTTVLSTESGTILVIGLPPGTYHWQNRPTCQHAWSRLLYRVTTEAQFLAWLTRTPRVEYS